MLYSLERFGKFILILCVILVLSLTFWYWNYNSNSKDRAKVYSDVYRAAFYDGRAENLNTFVDRKDLAGLFSRIYSNGKELDEDFSAAYVDSPYFLRELVAAYFKVKSGYVDKDKNAEGDLFSNGVYSSSIILVNVINLIEEGKIADAKLLLSGLISNANTTDVTKKVSNHIYNVLNFETKE